MHRKAKGKCWAEHLSLKLAAMSAWQKVAKRYADNSLPSAMQTTVCLVAFTRQTRAVTVRHGMMPMFWSHLVTL